MHSAAMPSVNRAARASEVGGDLSGGLLAPAIRYFALLQEPAGKVISSGNEGWSSNRNSSRDGVKVEPVPMAVQGDGGHEVLRHLSIQQLACIGNEDARRGHGHHVGVFAVAEAQRA